MRYPPKGMKVKKNTQTQVYTDTQTEINIKMVAFLHLLMAFSKAFDSVRHDRLSTKLKNLSLEPHIIN